MMNEKMLKREIAMSQSTRPCFVEIEKVEELGKERKNTPELKDVKADSEELIYQNSHMQVELLRCVA